MSGLYSPILEQAGFLKRKAADAGETPSTDSFLDSTGRISSTSVINKNSEIWSEYNEHQ